MFGVTLGTTFMRNFFTALNFTENAIYFADTAGMPFIDKEVPRTPSSISFYWYIVVIVGSLVVLACVANLVYLCCLKGRSCNPRQEDDNINQTIGDTFISKNSVHNNEEIPRFGDDEEEKLN